MRRSAAGPGSTMSGCLRQSQGQEAGSQGRTQRRTRLDQVRQGQHGVLWQELLLQVEMVRKDIFSFAGKRRIHYKEIKGTAMRLR